MIDYIRELSRVPGNAVLHIRFCAYLASLAEPMARDLGADVQGEASADDRVHQMRGGPGYQPPAAAMSSTATGQHAVGTKVSMRTTSLASHRAAGHHGPWVGKLRATKPFVRPPWTSRVAPSSAPTLSRLADASTLIEPGQTFALGGEQRKPVQLEGRNNGPVAIELLRRRDNEPPELIGRVMPGQGFSTMRPAGNTALVRNTSTDQPAAIRFVFNGQIDGLSMRCEPGRR